MKKQTKAALLVAVAISVFISCKWFQSNNKNEPSIVGKWKIDSVEFKGKDTSEIYLISLALLHSGKDSIHLEFNTDSTFREVSTKDTTFKKFYVNENELFVKEDAVYQKLHLSFLSDSVVQIATHDSAIVILKKI